ncbi:hypothetical protein C0J52_00222 [Blattella germanica]|nr:hypothetical protein C0J52_00222 [Blattella germanica]
MAKHPLKSSSRQQANHKFDSVLLEREEHPPSTAYITFSLILLSPRVGMGDAIGGLTTCKKYWQWQDTACHSTTTP